MITSNMTKNALQLLGGMIRLSRRQRQWTQAGLAERLGVSRQVVIAIEKGSLTVAIGTVFEAARIVGVPVLSYSDKQINQWQRVLDGFEALLPERIKTKNIEFDDDF